MNIYYVKGKCEVKEEVLDGLWSAMQILWFSCQFVVGNANDVVFLSVCGRQCKFAVIEVISGGLRGGCAPPGGYRGRSPLCACVLGSVVDVYLSLK